MYSEGENVAPVEYYAEEEEVYDDDEVNEEEEEGEQEFNEEEGDESVVEVNEPVSESNSSSLLNRLWSTNLVSWNDSSEITDTRGNEADPVRVIKQGDEGSLRHSALFVECDGFGQMSTSIILKVLSEAFEAAVEPIETPTGLEWVDDKSVVILWGSEFGSRQAFLHLTGQLLDEEYPLELLPTVLNHQTANLRLALASDGAAAKSEYYRKRQESHKPYSTSNRRSKVRKEDLDNELDDLMKGSSTIKQDLDAELDAIRTF